MAARKLETLELLHDLLAERFPTYQEVQQELTHPIPPIPFQPGTEGLTRLEVLLLKARSGR